MLKYQRNKKKNISAEIKRRLLKWKT